MVLCDALSFIPYRAKLCRAKFSSGETIRRAKFSSLNEKFVTFARRKVSPNKSKSVFSWSTNEPRRKKSHLDKFWLILGERNLVGRNFHQAKLFVGWNCRHFSKTSSLPPDQVSPNKVPKIPRQTIIGLFVNLVHVRVIFYFLSEIFFPGEYLYF